MSQTYPGNRQKLEEQGFIYFLKLTSESHSVFNAQSLITPVDKLAFREFDGISPPLFSRNPSNTAPAS
jgi:hypothetical protein